MKTLEVLLSLIKKKEEMRKEVTEQKRGQYVLKDVKHLKRSKERKVFFQKISVRITLQGQVEGHSCKLR